MNTNLQLAPRPGSRVAICGGCGGIGRALVSAAVDAGLDVAVLDLPSVLAVHPVPAGVHGIPCDVTNEDSVVEAFTAIGQLWDGLEALVNLVGFTNEPRNIEVMSTDEWDELIGGNLRSGFLVARAAIPLLRKGDSPAIVLTSSTFGVSVPHQGYGPYAISKAAIINFTRVLVRECSPTIRVNTLAPGLVLTDFIKGGTGRPTKSEQKDPAELARLVPLGRNAEPEDIAGPILFLIGPAAAFVSGQTLHVNGGAWS